MAKKGKGKPLAEGEEPPKKDNKKKIIIVVGLLAAWKMGFLPIGGSKDASAVTTTTAMWPGDSVDVGDPMVVNLADQDKVAYARVGIALVLPGHGENPATADAAGGHALGDSEHAASTPAVLAISLPPVPGGLGAGRVGSPQVLTPTPDQGGGAVDPMVAMEKKFPRMRAASVEIIRTFTSEELLSEAGTADLKAQLTQTAREIFGEHEVYEVVLPVLVVDV
jgi:flagellar basal body-associated protein FliL